MEIDKEANFERSEQNLSGTAVNPDLSGLNVQLIAVVAKIEVLESTS
jgi:hypothetical protein